jgi:hypothetical protein
LGTFGTLNPHSANTAIADDLQHPAWGDSWDSLPIGLSLDAPRYQPHISIFSTRAKCAKIQTLLHYIYEYMQDPWSMVTQAHPQGRSINSSLEIILRTASKELRHRLQNPALPTLQSNIKIYHVLTPKSDTTYFLKSMGKRMVPTCPPNDVKDWPFASGILGRESLPTRFSACFRDSD